MDAELIQQVQLARTGNLDAWAYVASAFRDTLLGLARRFGPRDAAEDIAQETFVLAFTHIRELNDVQAFPGWLSALARSAAHRLTRGRKLDIVDDLEADSPLEGPEAAAARGDLGRAVRAAVAGLDDRRRKLVERCYLEGVSLEAISREIGAPLGTVKRTLFEARQKLRANLAALAPTEIDFMESQS